jgi:DNA-binding NtrC family response regulator
LRERQEDIPPLVLHFVTLTSKRLGKQIQTVPPRVMEVLQKYHWPGNIRELQNVIERAVITTRGARLQLADNLDLEPQVENGLTSSPKESGVIARNGTLAEVEREYITSVLEKTYWRIEGKYGAAEILGINPSTLRHRMRRLHIQKPSPRV